MRPDKIVALLEKADNLAEAIGHDISCAQLNCHHCHCTCDSAAHQAKALSEYRRVRAQVSQSSAELATVESSLEQEMENYPWENAITHGG